MLKADRWSANRIGEALEGRQGVRLREHDARPEAAKADMLGGIGYVAAGVVEIMQAAAAGWAYLRP